MFNENNELTAVNILNSLRKVNDPDLHKDLISLGMIKDIIVNDKNVNFTLELTTPACPLKEKMKNDCIDVIRADFDDVAEINIKLTSRVRSFGIEKTLLKNVKNIIAVASGKGGVGKSTVSTNIAVSLAKTGAKVGLMDADVYGPTIPALLGSHELPEVTSENKIIPVEKYGIKFMSLGLLLPNNEPVIWRGPKIASIIQQFLEGVEWGELDYLVVDLPPGTGDAPLSLAQLIPISGVVIVSTPEDVSMNIATKSLAMFRNLNVKILGIVENMSYFVCSHCNERAEIFGHGGAKIASEKLEVEFLGEIPLDIELRKCGDAGEPISISSPESIVAKNFSEIAGNLAASLSKILVK